MTQAEIELIASEIRSRCLRSSWRDLVGFWGDVISELEGAYRAAVQHTTFFDRVSSSSSKELQSMVREKLAQALALLAGESQVARWEAEARSKLLPSGEANGRDG